MRAGFVFFWLLLGASLADATEVHLTDGSVVMGTIKGLVDGEDLVVDTKFMDDVTIEWDAIDRIVGTQAVTVELFNGRRITGLIALDSEGMQIIGNEIVTVQPIEVFAIEEVNETFWEGLDVYTDLGMNIVRGNNTVTQFSFGGGVSYDARDWQTGVSGTTVFNEQIDAQDTRRATLNANYTQRFRGNWSLTGLYQFETDEQQDLDGRSLVGGALGNRIYNKRHMRIELFGGLVLNSEEFTGTPRNETLEGLVGSSLRLRTKKGLDVDVSLLVLPSLEESDRVRTQVDASLSMDLIADFDFKVTVYDRFDSQPPAGNAENDYGVTLGLSWDN